MANQFLGQLTGKTLDAVMGNVGTTVVFQCGPDDTTALSAYMKPSFDTQSLLDMDRFEAAVKMQVEGRTQPAFSLMPPTPLDIPSYAQNRELRIRQHSIATYTPKDRNQVLGWLKQRYPRVRPNLKTEGDEETFYEVG
jgi:hypothetical protein